MTQKPLNGVVLGILKDNKNGFTISELQKEVLATGYKSSSANFKSVLYQCLYAMTKDGKAVHQGEVYRAGKG